MISGTSKIWSKSGPVALLTITNMLQKIQEKYGIILEHVISSIRDSHNFENFRKMYVLRGLPFCGHSKRSLVHCMFANQHGCTHIKPHILCMCDRFFVHNLDPAQWLGLDGHFPLPQSVRTISSQPPKAALQQCLCTSSLDTPLLVVSGACHHKSLPTGHASCG